MTLTFQGTEEETQSPALEEAIMWAVGFSNYTLAVLNELFLHTVFYSSHELTYSSGLSNTKFYNERGNYCCFWQIIIVMF